MKTLAIMIMLVSLYLLYRIAFPKQTTTHSPPKKNNDDIPDVVVKSRFIRPNYPQPTPIPVTPKKEDTISEKDVAPETQKRDVAIPPDKLDEVFAEDVNPDDLEIELDENEADFENETDLEEEAEDLRQTLGDDATMADGMTIEEMTETIAAINNPTEAQAELLLKAEKTDMFERLVSSDEGKATRIKAIIDRHMRSKSAETETVAEDAENDGNDWDKFDVRSFLGR